MPLLKSEKFKKRPGRLFEVIQYQLFSLSQTCKRPENFLETEKIEVKKSLQNVQKAENLIRER